MNISLKGKKALIGGSSSGIGKAIALQLAKSGASVILMARNKEKLKAIISKLPTQKGQQHAYLLVDFNDYETYVETIEKFFKHNKIDILINNTQGPKSGGTLDLKINDYQKAFDLLFKSVVLTTQLALEYMIDNQWGRIINVASISVKEPLSYLALSNSIRASVVTWSKTLANDVAQHQITVNSILTGYFDTERINVLNDTKAKQLGISIDTVKSNMEQQVPVKRIGNPKEYAYVVAFLASENASYITGTQIPIDGGLLKSL